MKRAKTYILALFSLTVFYQSVAYGQEKFHHVKDCNVCHTVSSYSENNLAFINRIIQTPNSSYREVFFTDTNGTNSYADGDATYNGICEVCHTQNNHHNNDGHDNTSHFDGQRCTTCHLHENEFAPPVPQAHRTHLDYREKGPVIKECTVCHQDPYVDPFVFRDGENLSNTTACDNCHSPWGAYPGGDPATALMDPVVGAKANFRTGIYESDGYTLKPGKEKWCITCHDDRPSTSKYDASPDAPPPTEILSYLATNDFGTGWANNISWAGTTPYYKTNSWGTTDIIEYAPFTVSTAGVYSVSMKWYASTSLTTCTNPGQELLVEVSSTGGSYDSMRWLQPSGSVDYLHIGDFNVAAGDVTIKFTKDLAGCFAGAGDIKFAPTGGSGGAVVFAPVIAGDDSTWGYYATGHGVGGVQCTECHDPRKKHIDYNYRTHEMNTTVFDSVVNPWGDSYRLQTKDTTSGESLCARCHDFRMIWDDGQYSQTRVGQTGMKNDWSGNTEWGSAFGANNVHKFHLLMDRTDKGGDSDWNGVIDSDIRCTNCHNVHGSTVGRMWRDGRLASDPYTTSKVPMKDMNFNIYAKAKWQPVLAGGDYNVSAWWPTAAAASNAAYYVKGSAVFAKKVVVDQSINGGTWVSLGTHHFEAGSKGYVFVHNKGANGNILADAVRFSSAGEDIIIDNTDANYTAYGTFATTAAGDNYGADYDYIGNTALGTDINPLEMETKTVNVPGVLGANINQNNMCSSCHGGSNPQISRPAFAGPKVLNRFEAKRWVLNDGTQDAEVYITAQDTDSNISSVTLNLTSIGGGSVAMAWVGKQTYKYTIPGAMINGLSDVSYKLPVVATDTDGNSATSEAYLFPKDGNSTVYMDTNEVELYSVNDFRFAINYKGDAGDLPADRTYFGPGYRYNVINFATGYGKWTPTIPATGKYQVYAFWNETGNSVKYTTYAADGTYEVIKDQNVNPGQWNLIGTYTFLADGGNYVHQISNDGTAMVADAMKFVKVNSEPVVRMSATQRNKKTRIITADSNYVTLMAAAMDYDTADTIDTLTFDWSGTDAQLLAHAYYDGSYGERLTFSPFGLAPGVYTAQVSVSDTSGATTTVRLALHVPVTVPVLGGGDTDGDGISDAVEGYTDEDEDGIPNYLDDSLARNEIPDSETLAIATEAGLEIRVGETALAAGSDDGVITNGELSAYGDDGVGQLVDVGLNNVGGLFDFDIVGLDVVGQSVKVVLPLQGAATIPASAKYRKYYKATGWQDFVIDANNAVYSAAKVGGVCPPVGSASYTTGLTVGHECVQLNIQDGGPNDADGLPNAEVKDPGAVMPDSSGNTVIGSGNTGISYSSGGGGSGAFGFWSLLMFGLFGLWSAYARR